MRPAQSAGSTASPFAHQRHRSQTGGIDRSHPPCGCSEGRLRTFTPLHLPGFTHCGLRRHKYVPSRPRSVAQLARETKVPVRAGEGFLDATIANNRDVFSTFATAIISLVATLAVAKEPEDKRILSAINSRRTTRPRVPCAPVLHRGSLSNVLSEPVVAC